MGSREIRYILDFDINHPFEPDCSKDDKWYDYKKENWEIAKKLLSKMNTREQDAVYFFCIKQWSDKKYETKRYEWSKRNSGLDD